jgi:multiple sugar transport system permease protein
LKLSGDRRTLLTGLAFCGPWLIGLAVFVLYPFISAFMLSFTRYSTLKPAVSVGLRNYADLGADVLARGDFFDSILVTLYFAGLSIPLGVALSLGLSILLNTKIRARALYRTIFYLPHLLPPVAVAVLWMWLFNGEDGLVNNLLKMMGVEKPPAWLANQSWSMPTIVMATVWGVGNAIVIYLAALQDVPQSLYEAADIDGANRWHRIRHITLPMISPIILFNVIMAIIGSFQYFTEPYMMTGGGPNRSTTVLAIYIYQMAFEDLRMGYACAMAFILFLIILGLTAFAMRVSLKFVHYEGR